MVVHHDKPRAHCTHVGSDSVSKHLILIPNDDEGSVEVVQPSMDMPPQTITDPPPTCSCRSMLQVA